jgi:hypothetical protein
MLLKKEFVKGILNPPCQASKFRNVKCLLSILQWNQLIVITVNVISCLLYSGLIDTITVFHYENK